MLYRASVMEEHRLKEFENKLMEENIWMEEG
jgi:hypothetical protein